MKQIDELPISPSSAGVYEHGWQSWSPSTTYGVGDRPHRPLSDRNRMLCYHPDRRTSADVFWGEGLLAIDAGDGSGIRVYGAPHSRSAKAAIRAELVGDTMVVSSDGPVNVHFDTAAPSMDSALAGWADRFASASGVAGVRQAPTIWCSWYQYFVTVTEADMIENIDAIQRNDLAIDVIQLDDGYQTAHGDWLSLSDRFGSLESIAEKIKSTDRRAGIWLAPFLVFPDSELAQQHPDWMVGGATAPVHAGNHWGRDLLALDSTHPGAMEYLVEVFSTLHRWGYDFFKIDFVYAGAMQGGRYADVDPLDAYRSGLRTIRSAIGDSYLLGCGAPILPSVGLVDAMRVSPDTELHYQPIDGDMSQPSSRVAAMTGRGRAFQHGRFWVNDPDCLIARPSVERREDWADHIRNFGGLRGSSDRIADLDDWGLATTRELLGSSPTEPFIS